jgi:hypothetical protein
MKPPNVFLVTKHLGLEDRHTSHWHYLLDNCSEVAQGVVDLIAERAGLPAADGVSRESTEVRAETQAGRMTETSDTFARRREREEEGSPAGQSDSLLGIVRYDRGHGTRTAHAGCGGGSAPATSVVNRTVPRSVSRLASRSNTGPYSPFLQTTATVFGVILQ